MRVIAQFCIEINKHQHKFKNRAVLKKCRKNICLWKKVKQVEHILLGNLKIEAQSLWAQLTDFIIKIYVSNLGGDRLYKGKIYRKYILRDTLFLRKCCNSFLAKVFFFVCLLSIQNVLLALKVIYRKFFFFQTTKYVFVINTGLD